MPSKGVIVAHSSPLHKHDSRFLEHKNPTVVRAYLGLPRFDTLARTKAIN